VSFLSLAFLAALPLAAAPIVLHWFDRRRSVLIHWGAMQFLREAATRKTSARRFQHWFLLLLRVLAVTALVLALARPLLPGSWFGVNDRRETILVIDNSMSALRRSGDGSAFAELLAQAEATIGALDPGSTVRMMSSSPYPAWVTPASMRVDVATRTRLVSLLHELRPTQGTSDLPATLLKAVQADLEDERLVGRRVILWTDGQRKDWRTDDRATWARFHAALESARVPTTLEVIEAAKDQPESDNIAVVRVRSKRTVVGVNQPLSVIGEVRNHSVHPSRTIPVTWFINDEKQGQGALPVLQPGETHEVVLHHSFAKPGVYLLTCRIDPDDDLQPDDSESIVIEVVERVPVLLVEGSEGFAEMQQDTYLVRAALGRIEGDESDEWVAVFEPRTVPPERLDSIDLDHFASVVIPNVIELSSDAVDRLTRFVADGGGLWLALGPRTNVDAFNKLLFNDGDGLSPVAISRMVDESQDEQQKPTINPFLRTHRATMDLADNERLDTGDIEVASRFRFQMPAEKQDVTVLLDLSNGEPLALENRLGKGRVIVQAIPLRLQWSGLAASQAFVVMVHGWLGYLTEPGATRHNLLPGDPISLYVAGVKETHATLTTPGGEDVPVAGEPAADGVVFRTSRTSLPGNYSLETPLFGSGLAFHVARDAGESDLMGLTDHDRTALSEIVGLNRGPIASRVSNTNLRAPIWPVLLILLVALMAGELVLSGAIARKRFGAAPIAEMVEQMTSEATISSGMLLGPRVVRRTKPQGKVASEVNA
jgi:hypothetical protein